MKYTARFAVALAAALFSLAPISVQAQKVLRSQTVSFDNYTAFKAVPEARFSNGHAAIVSDLNRSGMFIYTTTDKTALAAADPQECVFIDPDADPSNGGWVRQAYLQNPKYIDIKWCGAVPDDQDSGVQSANVTALQAAIDLIATDLASVGEQKGGVVFVDGAFYLSGGVTIDTADEGVALKGHGVREVEQPWSLSWDAGAGSGGNPTGVFYNPGPSALIFSHTTGDAIRAQARTFHVDGIEVVGTFARFNGGGSGSGIRCEPADSPGALMFNCHLTNVIASLHPDDGIQIVGFGNVHTVKDFNASRNGRHGIVVDRGYINNRTNIKGFTGQVEIARGTVYANKSHGIVVGAPDASGTHAGPYRIKIFDVDSSDNAYWPSATRYSERTDTTPDPDEARYADMYLDGENIEIDMSAFSGRENAFNRNLPLADNSNDCLHVSGNNIKITNSRFISCDVPLTWGNGSGSSPGVSEGLVVESVEIIGGTERPFFLEVPQQAKNARVNIHRDAAGTISKLIYDGDAADPETFPGSGVQRNDRNNIVGSSDLEWNGTRYLRNAITLEGTISKSGASSTLFDRAGIDDSLINMSGGSTGANGGQLQLYGENHASRPNQAIINADTITLRSQNGLTNHIITGPNDISFSLPLQGGGVNSFTLDAKSFETLFGAPTFGVYGSNRRVGWAFPAAASTNVIERQLYLPVSGNYSVAVYWFNEGATTGDVIWEARYRKLSEGEDVSTAGDGVLTSAADASGAQYTFQRVPLGTFSAAAGELLGLSMVRLGADAGDTLAEDAILVAVEIVYQGP